MISASPTTQDILKKAYLVSTSAGATIEYNLNSMVEDISATSDAMENAYTPAFQKLFPIDTIYKPFRPLAPGIKYLIHTDNNTDTPSQSVESPRDYEITGKPRLYYPGPDMTYKYWLAPKDTDINISLEYFANKEKTISKLIPANKIIARFETGHDTPDSWTITGVKEDNTTITVSGTTLTQKEAPDYKGGEAIIYYDGTTWSTTEPSTYTTTQYFKKISLQAVNSNNGKLIGVIEFSPRWVVSLDSDVVSLLLNKDTTSDDSSIVPVGIITANYLSLSINKPHTATEPRSKSIVEYDRSSTTIDNTKIYLFKNAIVRPYLSIASSGVPEKIFQGFFYVNSWSLSEFGDCTIDATDAAKILQDTICPQMLVQDSPITSIIKRVLDSVGFSTYNLNVKKLNNEVVDESVPSVSYWWSDGEKTVWEVLQELCRDIQMNAVVDEYNVLNFYSRDFMYDKERVPSWTFTSEDIKNGANLLYSPNIQSLTTKEIFSANQVRVRYSTAFVSLNSESSSPVWKSDTSFLGAGALTTPIIDSSIDFELEPNTVNTARTDKIMNQFNGYVLINSEVIEYDGIWYMYLPKAEPEGSQNFKEVLIKSQSDIWKYSALAKPGYKFFQPLNRYSIKKREAFGTSKENHTVAPDSYINEKGQNDSNKFTIYPLTLGVPNDTAQSKASSGSYFFQGDLTNNIIKKGFLSLSNLDKDKKSFDIAVKQFNSIDTSKNYFSFGTRMFFDTRLNTQEQAGGIGFCLDSKGQNGYYLLIRTSSFSGLKKDIMIVKVDNGVVRVLKDSQTISTKTFGGVEPGIEYAVDIFVNRKSNGLLQNVITVFINGFKIEATDSGNDSPSALNPPRGITNNVGMHCGQGVAYFEYLYADDIAEEVYLKNKDRSVYEHNGVYSDDTASMLHGNVIYNDANTRSNNTGAVFEFGTTAREIRKTKISFDDRPAIPLTFKTSLNKYVTLLDQKIQPFGGESYVLNNSSNTVSLDDGNNTSFYVLGNSIQRSGFIDYDTDQQEDSANKEFVVFESKWIQTNEDAKRLADWMKSSVLNKGRVVEMTVFGNPLISAGDVVTISYPILGMTELNNKYLVTKCTIEYREGITTSISCRAI